MKYLKRKIKSRYFYGDYEDAKRNFDSDYHKTNPADVNHEKIIKRKDGTVSKELDEGNDYELTLVTQNVLNYANRLEKDGVSHSEKSERQREKPVQSY